MSIQFAGLSSGLPVNDIINGLLSVEQKPIEKLVAQRDKIRNDTGVFSTLQSAVTKLQAAIKKITADSVLDENLFQSKKAASTEDATVSATVGSKASLQSYNIEVKKLATATKAASVGALGQVPTGTTRLDAFPAKPFTSGAFKLFVGGTASSITVDTTTQTVDDVLNQIRAVPGVTAAGFDSGGKLTISSASELKFGSTGDTSNFVKIAKLDTGSTTSGTLTASGPLSLLDTTKTDLTSAGLATAVTAGSTFKVGTATFDTTGKALADILAEINNSTGAGATATYNTATNKLDFVSKTTGNLAINLEDVTGNFLQATGLLVGSNSLQSQTLGQNAEFTVNGATLFSTSNEVAANVSGLTDVTLKLNATNVGKTAQVNVTRDQDKVNTSFDSFIKEFNAVVGQIDSVTDAKVGRLGIDSRLTSFRNSLRTAIVGAFGGTGNSFGSAIEVGLSTGAPTTAVGGTVSTALQFDKSKFAEALTKNAGDLEKLLRGPDGILRGVQKVVDSALLVGDAASGSGLFQAVSSSAEAKVTRLNQSIKEGQERLKRKETSLRRQFTASESLITQYKSQGTAISNLSARLGQNNN
jgi:flagellar hook-associated protein 2